MRKIVLMMVVVFGLLMMGCTSPLNPQRLTDKEIMAQEAEDAVKEAFNFPDAVQDFRPHLNEFNLAIEAYRTTGNIQELLSASDIFKPHYEAFKEAINPTTENQDQPTSDEALEEIVNGRLEYGELSEKVLYIIILLDGIDRDENNDHSFYHKEETKRLFEENEDDLCNEYDKFVEQVIEKYDATIELNTRINSKRTNALLEEIKSLYDRLYCQSHEEDGDHSTKRHFSDSFNDIKGSIEDCSFNTKREFDHPSHAYPNGMNGGIPVLHEIIEDSNKKAAHHHYWHPTPDVVLELQDIIEVIRQQENK